MKNRVNLMCVLLLLLLTGLNAAPINFKTAKETAGKFYGVQMNVASAKSIPALSCVYPRNPKAKGAVPYYIFNAGDNQGFVIVAGDDNATRSVLAYSGKGRFEMENMPENVKAWLGFYEESINRAAKSGIKGGFSSDFSKAEVVKGPLLGNISYNQDAPYNELCPIDPRTNMRSYTGCVATALASVARYYQYPKTGKGSITYSWKGQELSMDFSKNTYDWENILEAYNGEVSSYTQEQRTAVATLMRDFGHAVKMDYGSDASGAIRTNTVVGVVNYLGFDSILNFRERDMYDNDAQWIALLKMNIDNNQPVYYSGSGEGGGHAFVCDGYDDSDLFHFNWGWGGWCDGYFSVNNLDPGSTIGPGAGTGGGYSSYQGIMHNMVPPGHPHCTDEYLIMSISRIDPLQKEDSLYPIRENPVSVSFSGFQNYALSTFKGVVALGLFSKDGEFVKILSDRKEIEIGRQGTVNVQFNLQASLEEVEPGEYEIWAVSKTEDEEAAWNKVYAPKNNKYSNDSYIPVKIEDDKYVLLKTTALLKVKMDCDLNQNISMFIYSNGVMLGVGQVTSTTTRMFTMRYGTYELRFWTYGYDTTYVNVNITKDTSLLVPLKERLLKPYIQGVRVGPGCGTLMWDKESPRGEKAYPIGFVVYLDSVEVARVGESVREYVYNNLAVGTYQAGLSSIYATGESDMVVYHFRVRVADTVANELEIQNVCRLTPNPSTNGVFSMDVEKDCRLQVYTLSGNRLFERRLKAGVNVLNMTEYPAGIYVFRLEIDGQAMSLKAVLK